MYKLRREDYVNFSFDEYEKELNQRNYIVYDRDKMIKTLAYEDCLVDTLRKDLTDYMLYKSCGDYSYLEKSVVIRFLMEYENCPERYFITKKTADYSLDSKKVLEKLLQNGHAVYFIEKYMQLRSLISRNGKIRGYTARNTQKAGVNCDGIELSKLVFHVNQQKNMRYNYKEDDIIAIPKSYNDCISVDNDYFLAWGDFGQSDFRIAYNLFLRSPENDKIMNAYDDKYEALARMVAASEGVTFDLDRFKEERQLYKRLTLATVYGTRNSVVASEQPFIKKMVDFIYSCPKYVEYEKRIKDRIDIGLPLYVESYFGHLEGISNKYNPTDLLNDALNAPVQSGTSEIVCLTTLAILKQFRDLGYSEDDISVYYVRHDEPVFRIHKKVLKDIWILNQFSQILIDDWTPLRMDFNFGYYYKKPGEDLENQIHANYEMHQDKIEQIDFGNTINDFYPMPPVFTLNVSKVDTPDNKSIYTLYCADKHMVQYSLLNTKVEDELEYLITLVSKLEPDIVKAGYKGIRIIQNITHDEKESFIGDSYINVQYKNDSSMSPVFLLGNYMYVRYAKKLGLEYDVNRTPLESDAAFINSVQDLDLGGNV